VVVVSLALSWLATLYPAWMASRVQPAEALRHE
jgi:lipoprotein-releasing system permease protein